MAVGLVEVGSRLFVLPGHLPPPGMSVGSAGWVSNWWYPYTLASLGLISVAPIFMLFPASQPASSEGPAEPTLQADKAAAAELKVRADSYLSSSATLLGRLFSNPLFILTVVDVVFLHIGLYGLWNNMRVLLEEVYRSQVSLPLVGLLGLAVAPVVAVLVGALVARTRLSPRLLAILNVLLLGTQYRTFLAQAANERAGQLDSGTVGW